MKNSQSNAIRANGNKTNIMKDFFYADSFFETLEDFLVSMDIWNYLDAEHYIKETDSWECEETDEQPIFKITVGLMDKALSAVLGVFYDQNEDRYPEDGTEVEKDLKKSIEDSIDFDKINRLMPTLHYPNGTKFTITKKDILDYFTNDKNNNKNEQRKTKF